MTTKNLTSLQIELLTDLEAVCVDLEFYPNEPTVERYDLMDEIASLIETLMGEGVEASTIKDSLQACLSNDMFEYFVQSF